MAISAVRRYRGTGTAFPCAGNQPTQRARPRCRRQYWWFECAELVRKVLLTGFIVFFAPGSSTQIMCGILVCIASLVLTTGAAPFVNQSDDFLTSTAHLDLLMTLLGALMLKLEVPNLDGYDKAGFDALLLLFTIGPMVIFVGMLFYEEVYLRWRDRKEKKLRRRRRRQAHNEGKEDDEGTVKDAASASGTEGGGGRAASGELPMLAIDETHAGGADSDAASEQSRASSLSSAAEGQVGAGGGGGGVTGEAKDDAGVDAAEWTANPEDALAAAQRPPRRLTPMSPKAGGSSVSLRHVDASVAAAVEAGPGVDSTHSRPSREYDPGLELTASSTLRPGKPSASPTASERRLDTTSEPASGSGAPGGALLVMTDITDELEGDEFLV